MVFQNQGGQLGQLSISSKRKVVIRNRIVAFYNIEIVNINLSISAVPNFDACK